jgi:hypothetical protein
MIYDGGRGDSVEVTDAGVSIRRKGLKGLISQGLKGRKFLPFASISSVQFKDAGVTDGFIRFSIPGSGSLGVPGDENSVAFSADRAGDFRSLRDLVQQRISGAGNVSALGATPQVSVTASVASSAPAAVAPMSAATVEELSRLADLKDRGVITEAEFAAQKQALLSAPAATAIPVTVQVTSGAAQPAEEPIGYDIEVRRGYGCGKPAGIGCLGLIGLTLFSQLLALCSPASKRPRRRRRQRRPASQPPHRPRRQPHPRPRPPIRAPLPITAKAMTVEAITDRATSGFTITAAITVPATPEPESRCARSMPIRPRIIRRYLDDTGTKSRLAMRDVDGRRARLEPLRT